MKITHRLKSRILAGTSALVLSLAGAMPLMMGRAGATQITSRSLGLTTAVASATANYLITYTLPDTGNVGSMEFIFCTTAIGSCTAPTGLSVTSATLGAQTTNTGFSLGTAGDAPSNSATSSAYLGSLTTVPRVRITRTAAAGSTSSATVRFDTITNPSVNTQTPAGNNTFFVRFATFADTAYATNDATNDDGTVAAAIVPVLTINARVQEILHFCVGAETDANVAAWTTATDCSNISNTLVDLGPVDSTAVTASPDSDGNNMDGILMMRTNASAGSISYRSRINGSGTSGTLKKATDTCAVAAASASDGCFNYTTSSGGSSTLGSGVEGFGMWLNDDGDTDNASESATTNLVASAPYATSVNYVWQGDPTATTTIASQTGGVDDEAFQLKFGARSILTTQTGNYSTSADFIALATY